MTTKQILVAFDLDDDGSLRTLRRENSDDIMPTYFCPPMEAGRVLCAADAQRKTESDYEGN